VQSPDVHNQMFEMVTGLWVSLTIRAFADLSLADHLADGPLTAAEVAAREGSAPDTTFRLMRAGATLGLLTVDAHQRFHPTALLDTLRKDAPRSLRGLALGMTNRSQLLLWGEFVESVRKGHTQENAALGMNFWEYLNQHPAQAEEFMNAMEAGTSMWAPDVAELIDTSDVKLAVDVGGAHGALLRELQLVNPALRGIVFDRPGVATSVTDAIARSDVGDRTKVVGGDFFKAVPAADLYLLKFILHDWPDAACVEILSRCREAMRPGGRVAIVEFVLDDQEGHSLVGLMDVVMLAVVGGQERSLAEFDVLLRDAGLRRIAVRKSDSPQAVIEAVAT
jgi:O-methyltransferase domain/Dimerisation domain